MGCYYCGRYCHCGMDCWGGGDDDEGLDEGYRPRPGEYGNIFVVPPTLALASIGWIDPRTPVVPPAVDPTVPSTYVWPIPATRVFNTITSSDVRHGFPVEPVVGPATNLTRRIRVPGNILYSNGTPNSIAGCRCVESVPGTYFGDVGDCPDVTQSISLRGECYYPNFAGVDSGVNRFVTVYFCYYNYGTVGGSYSANVKIGFPAFSGAISATSQTVTCNPSSAPGFGIGRVDLNINFGSLVVSGVPQTYQIDIVKTSTDPVAFHYCYIESVVIPVPVTTMPVCFRGSDLLGSPRAVGVPGFSGTQRSGFGPINDYMSFGALNATFTFTTPLANNGGFKVSGDFKNPGTVSILTSGSTIVFGPPLSNVYSAGGLILRSTLVAGGTVTISNTVGGISNFWFWALNGFTV